MTGGVGVAGVWAAALATNTMIAASITTTPESRES
jgi:hypothetical protein